MIHILEFSCDKQFWSHSYSLWFIVVNPTWKEPYKPQHCHKASHSSRQQYQLRPESPKSWFLQFVKTISFSLSLPYVGLLLILNWIKNFGIGTELRFEIIGIFFHSLSDLEHLVLYLLCFCFAISFAAHVGILILISFSFFYFFFVQAYSLFELAEGMFVL